LTIETAGTTRSIISSSSAFSTVRWIDRWERDELLGGAFWGWRLSRYYRVWSARSNQRRTRI